MLPHLDLAASTAGARVLVVDDDAELRRSTVRTLRNAGLGVEAAADGCEALELFAEGRFSAVVTDVRMPRMGGLELLDRLLTIAPDLPVVLVSGTSEVESPAAAMAIGAFAFLQKPFAPSALDHAVWLAVETYARRHTRPPSLEPAALAVTIQPVPPPRIPAV